MSGRRQERSRWGRGAWDAEPDRREWRHEGMPCLLIRNRQGAWCGYVALGPGHPWRTESDPDVRAVEPDPENIVRLARRGHVADLACALACVQTYRTMAFAAAEVEKLAAAAAATIAPVSCAKCGAAAPSDAEGWMLARRALRHREQSWCPRCSPPDDAPLEVQRRGREPGGSDG